MPKVHSIRMATVLMAGGVSLAAMQQAQAAGFQLKEQSAQSQGNAFAGATATASDLSTIYFNPAGMTRLKHSGMDTNISYIVPSSTLTLENSSNPTAGAGTPLGNGNGGDAGGGVFVPAFYGMYSYDEDLKFGLSINTPFGLATEYDAGWAGRYHGLKSEIQSINVTPSVAYRINRNLSIGAGISMQYVEAELTKAVTDVGSANIANDGKSSLQGDDIGFGGRIGLLYEFNDATRVGASYQSRVRHNLKGEVEYKGLSAATIGALNGAGKQSVTHDASAKLVTPDIFSIGVSHDLNEKWTVLGEASRTQWSTFKHLQVLDSNGVEDENIYQNYQASHFVALGATYRHDKHNTFRFGMAFDEGAVETEHRTVRIPDADRYWLSVGYGYTADNFDVNIGYSYIKAADASLYETNTGTDGMISGTYDSDVNILAVNATWKF